MTPIGRVALALALAVSSPLAIGIAQGTAATLPSGFQETVIASGLASPTAMAFAPDGRIFVCQQGGQLRVIKNGALLATPFLTRHRQLSRASAACSASPSTRTSRPTTSSTSTTPCRRSPVAQPVSRFTASGDARGAPAASWSCSS